MRRLVLAIPFLFLPGCMRTPCDNYGPPRNTFETVQMLTGAQGNSYDASNGTDPKWHSYCDGYDARRRADAGRFKIKFDSAEVQAQYEWLRKHRSAWLEPEWLDGEREGREVLCYKDTRLYWINEDKIQKGVHFPRIDLWALHYNTIKGDEHRSQSVRYHPRAETIISIIYKECNGRDYDSLPYQPLLPDKDTLDMYRL